MLSRADLSDPGFSKIVTSVVFCREGGKKPLNIFLGISPCVGAMSLSCCCTWADIYGRDLLYNPVPVGLKKIKKNIVSMEMEAISFENCIRALYPLPFIIVF